MKKISEMQNYILNFAQENMQADPNKVENTVKKYLLRLKTNVAELNKRYHINHLVSIKNIKYVKLV